LSVDFVGSDGDLDSINPINELETLLGTRNKQEVIDVFSWLNETPTYLWRLNSRPDKLDERVAGFGANSGGADLGCCGYPSDSLSSLGVRMVREKI